MNGLLVLILLYDDIFILLIDDFDCLLNFIEEVQIKSFNRIFNLSDLSHPKVNEVSVVCLLYLLTVKFHFIVQKHLELALKLTYLFAS